jgi:hypothetical protein
LISFSGSGSNLGLLFRGGEREEPGERERGVRRDREGDEPEALVERSRNYLHVLQHLIERRRKLKTINYFFHFTKSRLPSNILFFVSTVFYCNKLRRHSTESGK